jgi:hypothetical protein
MIFTGRLQGFEPELPAEGPGGWGGVVGQFVGHDGQCLTYYMPRRLLLSHFEILRD